MAHRGVYKYFRPLIEISCILGDIALNITAKNADELFVQYLSWTTVPLMLKLPLPFIFFFTNYVVNKEIGLFLMLVQVAVLVASNIWLYVASKHITHSFRAIYKMRTMIDQLPQVIRPKHCNPTHFVWIILTIFLVEHISMMLVPMLYAEEHDYSIVIFALVFLLNMCTLVRYMLILSTLFYNVTLLFEECFDAFSLLSTTDMAQSYNLKAFSTMLIALSDISKDIYRVLGCQVLTLLILRVYVVVSNMLFFITARYVEGSNIVNVIQWSLVFALLIVSMGLATDQVIRLKEGIIRTPINILRKRDVMKMLNVYSLSYIRPAG